MATLRAVDRGLLLLSSTEEWTATLRAFVIFGQLQALVARLAGGGAIVEVRLRGWRRESIAFPIRQANRLQVS